MERATGPRQTRRGHPLARRRGVLVSRKSGLAGKDVGAALGRKGISRDGRIFRCTSYKKKTRSGGSRAEAELRRLRGWPCEEGQGRGRSAHGR